MTGAALNTSHIHPVRRWFGSAGSVALGVFLLGRLALEPLRDLPVYDNRGVDAYSAIETYLLRDNPVLPKIAFFGTSQSVWDVVASDFATDWGLDPGEVRNLSTEGGTPFDIWNMVRRNEGKLKELRLAIVEVNPLVLRHGMDTDPRVRVDVAQHATLRERLLISDRRERAWHVAEWALPVRAVRQPLRNVFLNVLNPQPGHPIYPYANARVTPVADWRAENAGQHQTKARKLVPPELAAKRFVGGWRLSKLQDHSLRQALQWFASHGVRVIFHELPVHPEVHRVIRDDGAIQRGHANFISYLDTLPPPAARFLNLDPAAFGIEPLHMADRTHCNELGAHLYSHQLAAMIRPFLPRSAPSGKSEEGSEPPAEAP